jgi:uncharacterized glyoxalase superfamily protein PhnB
MKKLAPVIIVDRVEPCLDFWKRLGFEVVVEVPEGDAVGFAILARGGVELMYQSRASVQKDAPAVAALPPGHSIGLYIEVESLDEVLPALEGADVIVPRRTTFYGATEIFVREPSGQVVGFAQQGGGEAGPSA